MTIIKQEHGENLHRSGDSAKKKADGNILKARKKSAVNYFVYLIAAIIMIIFDQVTKIVALKNLVSGPFVIIDGVFEFLYVQNRGAAFGILQNSIPFFLIIGCAILFVVIFFFIKIPEGKRFLPINISLLLLFSGAIGNIIDRIFRHYVVDFLYFKLIDFPVFNVADCYVTIGAALLIVCVIFVYKERDELN